jgi:hypothetical protein
MKTIETPRDLGPAASPGLPLPRFHLAFHRKPLPPGTTAETVLDAIATALRRGRARKVIRGVDRIDFVGPSPSGSGTTLLGRATGPGAVWIEREGDAFYVRYSLGFQTVYLMWSVMAVFGVLFFWIAGEPAMAPIAFLVSSFPAVVTMTLTVVSFDTGLREAVLDAAHKAAAARTALPDAASPGALPSS